jgi:hypothetical protein
MPKAGTLITRLAQSAAATSMIGGIAFGRGDNASTSEANPAIGEASAIVEPVAAISANTLSENASIRFSVASDYDEWNDELEKEFRSLALKEAEGTLSADSSARLHELNWLRDTLKVPRTSEEILLQIQRDRIVDKLSAALEEYVEFQKAARHAGFFSQ